MPTVAQHPNLTPCKFNPVNLVHILIACATIALPSAPSVYPDAHTHIPHTHTTTQRFRAPGEQTQAPDTHTNTHKAHPPHREHSRTQPGLLQFMHGTRSVTHDNSDNRPQTCASAPAPQASTYNNKSHHTLHTGQVQVSQCVAALHRLHHGCATLRSRVDCSTLWTNTHTHAGRTHARAHSVTHTVSHTRCHTHNFTNKQVHTTRRGTRPHSVSTTATKTAKAVTARATETHTTHTGQVHTSQLHAALHRLRHSCATLSSQVVH